MLITTCIHTYIHTYIGSMHLHSTSLHPLSTGTPGTSVWPSPRHMPDPSPSFRDRTFQAPTRKDPLSLTHRHPRRPPSRGQHLSTTPNTLQCVLRSEVFSGGRSANPALLLLRLPPTTLMATIIATLLRRPGKFLAQFSHEQAG